VAGKVKSVSRTTGSIRKPLSFAYGASGQRILKTVSDPDLDVTGSREHYIRDAQGHIMATYRYTNPGSASLQLNDRPLYGSARLGTLGEEMELHSLLNWDPAAPVVVDQVDLNYELTDHLGNVCTVVTGRLLDGNGGGTLKQAELVSAQGYEPGGSLLPGRNYSSSTYNYGFNGQLKDDEVYGSTGTSYTAEFWQYDPRTGRRWNIDPVVKSWESGYATFRGNPIWFQDPNGDNASTDVVKNDDGSYTVVGAKDDGDNNIYVVPEPGGERGEVIGQTENPWDFLQTRSATNEFTAHAPVTFRLDALPDGDAMVNRLASEWEADVMIGTAVPSIIMAGVLALKSRNGGDYDIKSKFSEAEGGNYAALSLGGKITTVRTAGNILFGRNMRTINRVSLDQSLTPAPFFYLQVMPVVGAYNQHQNNGNGYNSGWPFFGEETYSGTGIYQGYFGRKPE
jgi:hypothetical protein